MKKNEYKKKDAKGNKLPEQIGKGLNKDFMQKTTEKYDFKVTPRMKLLIDRFVEGGNTSAFFRKLLDVFFKEEIPATKIDFIVTELTLKDERIAELEQDKKELKETLDGFIKSIKK